MTEYEEIITDFISRYGIPNTKYRLFTVSDTIYYKSTIKEEAFVIGTIVGSQYGDSRGVNINYTSAGPYLQKETIRYKLNKFLND